MKKPLLIPSGEVFTFENYDGAYSFLQDHKDNCEKGVILGISYNKTNEVVSFNVRGVSNV